MASASVARCTARACGLGCANRISAPSRQAEGAVQRLDQAHRQQRADAEVGEAASGELRPDRLPQHPAGDLEDGGRDSVRRHAATKLRQPLGIAHHGAIPMRLRFQASGDDAPSSSRSATISR